MTDVHQLILSGIVSFLLGYSVNGLPIYFRHRKRRRELRAHFRATHLLCALCRHPRFIHHDDGACSGNLDPCVCKQFWEPSS